MMYVEEGGGERAMALHALRVETGVRGSMQEHSERVKLYEEPRRVRAREKIPIAVAV